MSRDFKPCSLAHRKDCPCNSDSSACGALMVNERYSAWG